MNEIRQEISNLLKTGEKLEPGIYLVPTPIGNLEDITLRAIRVLSAADIIACEDTRNTGKLLKLYNINAKKFESYHEHNELQKSQYLINKVKEDLAIALVTDAGSPGISDPGYRLVQEAIKNNIKITALPGATAFIPALTASGLPTNQFKFFGFPPQKKGRKTFLENVSHSDCTAIIYESPFRITKLIDELTDACGNERNICIVREISKMFEEYIRGSLFECKEILKNRSNLKGEFVIIIDRLNSK